MRGTPTSLRAARAMIIAASCAAVTAFGAQAQPPGAQPPSAQTPSAQPPSAQTPDALARHTPRGVRFVTWNIGANSILPLGRVLDSVSGTRSAAFGRVMRALDADVVCLQEYTGSTSRLALLFDALLPVGGGRHWQTAQSLGNTIVSRYALHQRDSRVMLSPLARRSHVHAIVDLPDSIAPIDPVVMCTHLQSGGSESNAAFRTRHSEAIVRDLAARVKQESVSRPAVVLGDMNAVNRSLPYLLSVPASPGVQFPLRSGVAAHNGVGPESYTWRDDGQRFDPGVLDYILFSERAFTARHAFVLNTMALDTTSLTALGLKATDIMRNAARGTHDHLPVVADLEPLPVAPTARPRRVHSGGALPRR